MDAKQIDQCISTLYDKTNAYIEIITKFNNDAIHKILACQTTIIRIGNNEYSGMLCGAGALFIINVEADIKQVYNEIAQDVNKYKADIQERKKIEYIDKAIFDELEYYCDMTTRTVSDLNKMLTHGVVMHHDEPVSVGEVTLLLSDISSSVDEIGDIGRRLYETLTELVK